jgi:hypothetical protein
VDDSGGLTEKQGGLRERGFGLSPALSLNCLRQARMVMALSVGGEIL